MPDPSIRDAEGKRHTGSVTQRSVWQSRWRSKTRLGRVGGFLLFATLLLGVSPVAALTIHYDADRDAQLVRCDAHSYRGADKRARRCYEQLLNQDDVLLQADAAAALGDVGRANRLYREAAQESREPAVRTKWAELYRETHQISDAQALFREALVFDPDYLPAQLGLAEAMADAFESEVREMLDDIRAAHPDNLRALLLLARIELEVQNIDAARELLERALQLAEQQGWPPLEIYGLYASAALLEDQSMRYWINQALAYNPRYGEIFATAAHFYIITYRYREAVELYRRAVNARPDFAEAHRDLGINLLRINQVYPARHHLEKAYEIDPFDAQTVNTLRLLEKLDDMRISSIDVMSEEDGESLIGRALIRLDREDADALEPYVHDLVRRAMRSFTERYDFRLRQPMIVELYHDHDDFGVRTVSTPGIGLLGVTFGYLTAMDSPKARSPGEFHWGTTLWHEIAHVYTLEATSHRLPRWLSEGLSVYEEWHTGPLADRELPLETLAALKAGRFLPIARLDSGFVRPTYQGQVQVSYMQAGLICDYIANRWDHDALVRLLEAFAEGASVGEALRAAVDLSPSEFDTAFTQFIETRYGDLLEGLDDYRVANRQLGRALELDDWISVEALSRDIIRRYPERIGNGNAYEVLAEAQRKEGDREGSIETLLEWHRRGGHHPESLRELSDALIEAGRDEAAAEVIESLNWVMPYAAEPHRWLGNHYLDTGQEAWALREFDALLGLQPDDPAAAYLGKARAAFGLGDRTRARREVLYSLEHSPFYRPAQRLLLDLTQGGQP